MIVGTDSASSVQANRSRPSACSTNSSVMLMGYSSTSPAYKSPGCVTRPTFLRPNVHVKSAATASGIACPVSASTPLGMSDATMQVPFSFKDARTANACFALSDINLVSSNPVPNRASTVTNGYLPSSSSGVSIISPPRRLNACWFSRASPVGSLSDFASYTTTS